MLPAIVFAACVADTEPPEPIFEVVVPLEQDALLERAGSEYGAAFVLSSSLHVFRANGAHHTTGADVLACPWPARDPSTPGREQVLVLRDRTVFVRRGCGVWAYRDGSAAPDVIGRFTALDNADFEWSGVAETSRVLGVLVAAHGDRLFNCVMPSSEEIDRRPQIWSLPFDGVPSHELLGRLDVNYCDRMIADDRAVFVNGGEQIFRLDRATREVRLVAKRQEPEPTSHLIDFRASRSHLYWSNYDYLSGTSALRRVSKDGGPIETVTDAATVWPYQLEGDGADVFLMRASSVTLVDGLALKPLLSSSDDFGDALVGGGDLFVRRDRTGDDPPAIARFRRAALRHAMGEP